MSIGPRALFHCVEFVPPVDALDEHYPIRLTPVAGSTITTRGYRRISSNLLCGARKHWVVGIVRKICQTRT
jgi:hypothetical protein